MNDLIQGFIDPIQDLFEVINIAFGGNLAAIAVVGAGLLFTVGPVVWVVISQRRHRRETVDGQIVEIS